MLVKLEVDVQSIHRGNKNFIKKKKAKEEAVGVTRGLCYLPLPLDDVMFPEETQVNVGLGKSLLFVANMIITPSLLYIYIITYYLNR